MDVFGNEQNGVCWLDPYTQDIYSCNDENIEMKNDEGSAASSHPHDCLTELYQKIMTVLNCDVIEKVDELPVGKKKKKKKVSPTPYRPHMTFNHSPNLDIAKSIVNAEKDNWTPIKFTVYELYLMERTMPDGQFYVVAKIPLGRRRIQLDSMISDTTSLCENVGEEREESSIDDDVSAMFLDPPQPFPLMPESEDEWVRNVAQSLSRSKKSSMSTKADNKKK